MSDASVRATSTVAGKAAGIIAGLGLSQDEVGAIVDASGRSIARWISGAASPQRLSKQRLLELAYVAEALAEVLPRERANTWILSPNRLLDHESPAHRIHDGRYREVLGLIDGLAEGVIV
ncbi:hypothetical protein [uncultured Amnibacterium sp.]|uniref:hypothetical protein n=1 Tax=uncultured Amnibacterium sp. TaxID=1631851 RepID=UPI0035CA0726